MALIEREGPSRKTWMVMKMKGMDRVGFGVYGWVLDDMGGNGCAIVGFEKV